MTLQQNITVVQSKELLRCSSPKSRNFGLKTISETLVLSFETKERAQITYLSPDAFKTVSADSRAITQS